MDNQQFLQAYENKITIEDNRLLVNGILYTELLKDEAGEVTVEYLLSGTDTDTITEAQLTSKALELTRKFYKQSLEKLLSSEQLLVLTGAGSSKDDAVFGGKLMTELWDLVTGLDHEGYNFDGLLTTLEIPTEVKAAKDLESLLSRAKLYLSFKENTEVEAFVEKIEKMIYEHCNFQLLDNSVHLEFVKQLTNRKSKQGRLKVFTTNYDTAFEQAGSEGGYVLIDGFSFTQPRKFNGKYFDYDIVIREGSRIAADENFASNVFHLYKLHGSVNWEKREEEVVQVDNPAKALMIYPNNNKYESSYEQPYFEMMSRLQSELRKKGTNTLIVVGFSFADKHIFTMIKEALNHNASLNLIVIEPFIKTEINENFKYLYEYAQKSNQVIIIGEYFKEFVGQMPKSNYFGNTEDNHA